MDVFAHFGPGMYVPLDQMQVRHARTVQNGSILYPRRNDDHTYPITFLDGSFVRTAGCPATISERGDGPQAFVANVNQDDNGYIEEGTDVMVYGMPDASNPGRIFWWTCFHETVLSGKADAAIAADATGTVSVCARS